MMLRTIFLSLVVSIIAPNQETTQTYRGHYVNVDYGFAVDIPHALVGEGNPIHAPNHGFKIRLHPNSAIWVDASYDAADPPQQFSHFNARLGTLQAVRRSWKTTEQGIEVLHESVTAEWSDRGTPIIYTVEVDSTAAYQNEAISVLEAVLKSFRKVPVRP
jgi:hypothetical protein